MRSVSCARSPHIIKQMTLSALTWAFLNALAGEYTIPFVAAMLVGVPSILLYAFQIWTILRQRQHFGSSFFRLVVARSAMNFVNYVNGFLMNRFGKLGLFLGLYLRMPSVLLALFYFVGPYSLHVDNLSTAFLLLNRLSALIRPVDYEKLWRKGLPIALAITFVAPLPLTLPIFLLDVFVHVQTDNVTFTIDDHKTPNELDQNEISAISSVAFIVVCLALNVASLVVYKCFRRRKKVSEQDESTASMERKMTVYIVLTFFSQLILALYYIVIFVTNFHVDEHNNTYTLLTEWFSLTLDQDAVVFFAAFNQQAWLNDLFTVALPAWLLLWASTKMREIIGAHLAWLRSIRIQIVVAPQPPTGNVPTTVVVSRSTQHPRSQAMPRVG